MRALRFKRIGSIGRKILLKLVLPFILVILFTQFTCLFFWFKSSAHTPANSIVITCSDKGRILVTSNGRPHLNPYWQASEFLSINLGFRSLSFASAKLIDICWDLVIGRGGQVLLCILVYPVVRRSLVDDMQRRPIRIETYTSIAFDRISFTTLKALLEDIYYITKGTESKEKDTISEKKPSRRNWRYIWYCLVVIYVLLFPTMTAAMTGYQALFEPYIHIRGRSSPVQISELKIPTLVVRDGGRIGLGDNHPVFENDPKYEALFYYAQALKTVWSSQHSQTGGSQNCYVADPFDPSFSHSDDHSQSLQNCPMTFSEIDRLGEKHALDALRIGDRVALFAGRPLNILLQGHKFSHSSFPAVQYIAVDNTALDLTDIQETGLCQQSQRYTWGFSFLILFVFCIATLIFAMVLAALHYDTFWSTLESGDECDFNKYRDAVDIVYALQDQHYGNSLRSIPSDELRKRLGSKDSTITMQKTDFALLAKQK